MHVWDHYNDLSMIKTNISRFKEKHTYKMTNITHKLMENEFEKATVFEGKKFLKAGCTASKST